MTTATLTLTDFLLARLDEDEEAARAAADDASAPWAFREWPDKRIAVVNDARGATVIYDEHAPEHRYDVIPRYVARWDPARVLAECAAKRAIVELHRLGGSYTPGSDKREGFDYCATCGSGEPYEYPTEWPCRTLRLLAQPYAEHPDYREEWWR